MDNEKLKQESWEYAYNALMNGDHIADINGKNILNIAILNDAPEKLILKIIEVHPELARDKGEYGNLSLHYALSLNKLNEKVIRALFNVYPDALEIRNNDGYMPGQAILKRNINIIDKVRILKKLRADKAAHDLLVEQEEQEEKEQRKKEKNKRKKDRKHEKNIKQNESAKIIQQYYKNRLQQKQQQQHAAKVIQHGYRKSLNYRNEQARKELIAPGRLLEFQKIFPPVTERPLQLPSHDEVAFPWKNDTTYRLTNFGIRNYLKIYQTDLKKLNLY
jgi:hypothetical protein